MKVMRWAAFLLLMSCSFLCMSLENDIIKKSPMDDRQYKSMVLENGLRVMVVHDKDAPQASAALVVNAGLFDDPKEFSGLAHFLEHMLFLGTSRYPVPDEFQNYIQSHGGERNAMTEGDKTSFYFTIQPDALAHALDRFADFFISPAFYSDYIERELNAVDQEFHLYLSDESWSMLDVQKETSNPLHPFSRHFGGNLQTLGHDKAKLALALKDFFKQHYHAKNMTLVIAGPQSAQELLLYAKHYFSAISAGAKDYQKPTYHPVFSSEQLGLDIHIKTKGEYQELTLIFPMTYENDLAKQKSQRLVASILGQDGKGSLSQALKKKDWIAGMSASWQTYSQGQDALTLTFSLTNNGLAKIDDITRYTFTAVEYFKKKGIPTYFIDETKMINQSDYWYVEKGAISDLALGLATALQEISPADILQSGMLLPNDPISEKVIEQTFSKIIPDNMRRMIVTPYASVNQKSNWYRADYRIEKILPMKLKHLAEPIWFSHIGYPEKNRFIPTSIQLAKQPEKSTTHHTHPRLIKQGAVAVWHQQDTVFKQPKGSIVVDFRSPYVANSAKGSLLAAIYSQMMTAILDDAFYSASLSGASISFSEHAKGLTLSVAGFTDKQDRLLREVLLTMKQAKFNEAEFEGTKYSLIRRIKNFHQRTLLEQAQAELSALILSPIWHPNELVAVADNLSYSDFESFYKQFWSNNQTEMLVYGNYHSSDALALGELVVKSLSLKEAKKPMAKGYTVATLPKGKKQIRQIKSDDENHVLLWYWQHNEKSYEALAKTFMLVNLLEVPYFQSLRVEKQLAYSLGVNAFTSQLHCGLNFWIQSSHASPNQLKHEIEVFLKTFGNHLARMSEQDYLISRSALIQQLSEHPKNQMEQMGQSWSAISQGETSFDRNKRIADALAYLSRDDMVRFYHTMMDPHAGQLFVTSAPLVKDSQAIDIVSIQAFPSRAS